MNPANLPFDSEAMLEGLRGWVECESPTWDASAVDRMLDIAARDMAIMGASIERIAGRRGFGGCIRAHFPHPRKGEPGILIAGHLDTVHPVGTLEKLKWRRDGNKCFGPGIFDMKGGNYLALEAIRQLARASFTTPLPITVLFTPDEEVGTPSTRDIIEAEAARNKYVLVPEPGRPDNGGVERMLVLSGTSNDVTFKVTRGVTRPVWEPNAGTMALYERARGVAKQMGVELPHGSAGGGSDGNFTGAMGIPTLDGLGVRGADAHTLNEHIEVDSLAERGRLMAGLLATLE